MLSFFVHNIFYTLKVCITKGNKVLTADVEKCTKMITSNYYSLPCSVNDNPYTHQVINLSHYQFKIQMA